MNETLAPVPAAHPIMERHPDVAALVTRFYERARQDRLIGPVFNTAVADWPHHLASITAFWAAQLRGRGVYHGQPMAAHMRHAARIRPEMFARWLELWQQTTTEMMPPDEAATLQAKASRIAAVLGDAVAGATGGGA